MKDNNNNYINTGGIFVDKDERDYDLTKVGASLSIPEVHMPSISAIPTEHQTQQPTCGAHAGTMVKNIMSFARGKLKRLSPRFFWKMIKSIDGWPLSAGTDIYSILKAMQKFGACDYKLTGDDTKLSMQEYVNLQVTPEMVKDAEKEKIESYATAFKPSFEEIKRAIYVNKGVLMLTRVGQNMYRPSWHEEDNMPLNPDRYPMDSGHFVALYGYDKDHIYYRNSWGPTWARKGDGYMTEDYVKWIDSIGTMVDRADVTNEVLPAFTRDLTVGFKGIEVKNLQVFLNNSGFPVASKGPGSKGYETSYFGELTRDALTKFQLANNIRPAHGYFGPITRRFINTTLNK